MDERGEDEMLERRPKRVCAVVSSEPLDPEDTASIEDSCSDSDVLERLLLGDDGLALLCDFDCGPLK